MFPCVPLVVEREGTSGNALYLELYPRGAAMEMQVRGWREERHVTTYDTTGKPVPVVTGLTVDRDGKTVAAIAIGNGPSAILDGDASQIRTDIVSTIQDLKDARRAGR